MTTDIGTGVEEPVRVAIDPRIRQRRIAVRRDEGRRRLRVLVIAASTVGAVLLGWVVTRSPVLDVDRLRVVGARQATPASVLAALDVGRGDALLDVDEEGAARRVERLPWVDDADVRREWPGTVVVTVTERRPAASVRARGGGWMLVDASGRLLARRPLPQEGLPAIEGGTWADDPGGDLGAPARAALRVANAIPAERVPAVPVVAVLDGGELELRLAPSGVARLGSADQLEAKLLAVFTVLDRVDLRGLERLDVRVPSAPVVTRQP